MARMRHLLSICIVATIVLLSGTLKSQSLAFEDNDTLFIPPLTYEHIPDVDYETMEKRIKELDSRIPMNFNTRVKSFIDYFTLKDREYTKMVMRRSRMYFPLFERYLKKYDMPEELKYLAIVESGLTASARSRAAAVGLWQFMYYTGKMYGLNSDWFVDDRMDPEKSTDAACKYIKSLYNTFDDWELALAAYNCGPGNVRRAIRRSGYKKKFWDIYKYLPRETRGYVPQFVAVTYAFEYADEHNLVLEDEEYDYPIEYDTIMVKSAVKLSTIADLLNVCHDDMEIINTAIKNQTLPESKKYYTINIPSDKHEYFTQNRSFILDSAAKTGKKELKLLAKKTGSTYGRDKIVHRVRSGDVLGRIAQRYHVRVTDLKRWNNLRSNTIRVGQKLNVWTNNRAYASVAKSKSSTSTISSTPVVAKKSIVVNGTKYHIVQPGDTLWDIVKAYDNLTVEKLKTINNLKTNKIKPGQKLVVG
jgi:membrane-bound lytic murein transglycosylase D